MKTIKTLVSIYFLLLIRISFVSNLPLVGNSDSKKQFVCESGNDRAIKRAIKKSEEDIKKFKMDEMVPGIVVGISIKGKNVWTKAFGHTDIENKVKTHKDSVWRMASISKSLTTVMIGKLMERGLIDLENSIHDYLSTEIFPIKQWNKKNVTITVKQVMSHTAGLRVTDIFKDFLTINYFKNVTQTVEQFKNDPLICEPGTSFNYSNYGFQIVGAIIESVLNETYEKAINKMFKEIGMNSTFAERHDMIIDRRARYYLKNEYYSYFVENWNNVSTAEILSAPIIDDLVSLKAQWPSGGLVSTVPDLLKFGNYMLNSYKGIVGNQLGIDF
jgi:CubicO group peptidase (beta-lactamase class C family)